MRAELSCLKPRLEILPPCLYPCRLERMLQGWEKGTVLVCAITKSMHILLCRPGADRKTLGINCVRVVGAVAAADRCGVEPTAPFPAGLQERIWVDGVGQGTAVAIEEIFFQVYEEWI